MPDESKQKLSIYLSNEAADWLRGAALTDGVEMSALVEEFALEFLRIREGRRKVAYPRIKPTPSKRRKSADS